MHGRELIKDTSLELNYGRRYGLIGTNGSGKSTLLSALGERELPVPEHIDIFHLTNEVDPSDKSALECVLADLMKEVESLEDQLERIIDLEGGDSPALDVIHERLETLDVDQAEPRAASILHGLGFTPAMQAKASKEFSGGWRMRISLAKALFTRPFLLLLDEPTNHLDLESCVWLENYLSDYPYCLVMISHSQDFLNGVCTNIIQLENSRLTVFGGNYDIYCRTKAELEENQSKKHEWEQKQIAHMKDYIARFGHGSAKLARQAQSKEKVLKKMVDNGLTEEVKGAKSFAFQFPSCGELAPPVLQFQGVSFQYGDAEPLYSNLDLGIDLDSRVALVGPNGAGKSTLLKLMARILEPTDGMIKRHHHLRVARYHQHLSEQLDMDKSPLEFMRDKFADKEYSWQECRSRVGRFGITGEAQTLPIRVLSDGMKSRVVFAYLATTNPHMLLFDEPTNHLDMETIDALANAINQFDGGMVLVSHDFRLINQVAEEIWVCEKQEVKKWPGDIDSYKAHLQKVVLGDGKKR